MTVGTEDLHPPKGAGCRSKTANMERLHINTPRMHLRNLEPGDLEDFHCYRSNPEVTRYQGFDVMTMEEAKEFIETQKDKVFGIPGEWVQYGLIHRETGKLLGDCALRLDQHDPRIAEIGITISHLEQRKGYAKEALKGLLSFLFGARKIHRVVGIVDAENMASIKLFQRSGFRQEGHFIENIFFKGKWGSEYQFALLRREWENLPPS